MAHQTDHASTKVPELLFVLSGLYQVRDITWLSGAKKQIEENCKAYLQSDGTERQDTSSSKKVSLRFQHQKVQTSKHLEDIYPLLISLTRFQT